MRLQQMKVESPLEELEVKADDSILDEARDEGLEKERIAAGLVVEERSEVIRPKIGLLEVKAPSEEGVDAGFAKTVTYAVISVQEESHERNSRRASAPFDMDEDRRLAEKGGWRRRRVLAFDAIEIQTKDVLKAVMRVVEKNVFPAAKRREESQSQVRARHQTQTKPTDRAPLSSATGHRRG